MAVAARPAAAKPCPAAPFWNLAIAKSPEICAICAKIFKNKGLRGRFLRKLRKMPGSTPVFHRTPSQIRPSAKTRGLTKLSQGRKTFREGTPPPAAAWTVPSVPRFSPRPQDSARPSPAPPSVARAPARPPRARPSPAPPSVARAPVRRPRPRPSPARPSVPRAPAHHPALLPIQWRHTKATVPANMLRSVRASCRKPRTPW